MDKTSDFHLRREAPPPVTVALPEDILAKTLGVN